MLWQKSKTTIPQLKWKSSLCFFSFLFQFFKNKFTYYLVIVLLNVALSPSLDWSHMILVHCKLRLLSSSDSPASGSQVAEITGARHHAQLIFVFFVGMEFHHAGQAGLELLTSDDPPTLASQVLFLYSYHPAQGRMCPSKGQGRKTPEVWFC